MGFLEPMPAILLEEEEEDRLGPIPNIYHLQPAPTLPVPSSTLPASAMCLGSSGAHTELLVITSSSSIVHDNSTIPAPFQGHL